MARIPDGVLRDWANGDIMNSSDYEGERAVLVTAINDNQAQHDTLKSTGGASTVGAAAIPGLAGVTVQDLLVSLKNKADSVVLGQLPPSVAANMIEFANATNTGNAYAVTTSSTMASYTDGYGVAFRTNADATGATTLNVNALGPKPIFKSNGLAVSNLKTNGVYTVRYNATSGNFILQGEGGEYGTATASQVLATYTFGTDTGVQTGTMTNRGSMTISAGTTNQTIPQGYHDGTGKVVGDPNLLATNIASDSIIFGVQGTLARATDTNRTNLITAVNSTLGS